MYVLAETISGLTKEVTNISAELSNFKWAFGLVVSIILAYGLGSGWTLMKISDNQVKKIEDELSSNFNNQFKQLKEEMDDFPKKWHEEDCTDSLLTVNGWKKEDNSYFKKIYISNVGIWKLHIILRNENYIFEDYSEVFALPINAPFNGPYPAYLKETQQWVTIFVDKNKRAIIYGVINHSGKTTLNIDLTLTDIYKTDFYKDKE